MSRLHDLDRLLGQSQPDLARALLYVSEVVTGRSDATAVGLEILDEISREAPTTIPDLVDHCFVTCGFGGDIDDYHSLDNSLLDRVLERRLGMPITLAAVIIAVGARVGVRLHGVGMPGHFLVGTEDPTVLIDPFAGAVIDEAGAAARFRQLHGPEASFSRSLLPPVDTHLLLWRVCNNLTNTFLTRDRGGIDRLLDVQMVVATDDQQRAQIRQLAQLRARWDVAAGLIDDDNEAAAYWARLN